jgi:hypothetical protein
MELVLIRHEASPQGGWSFFHESKNQFVIHHDIHSSLIQDPDSVDVIQIARKHVLVEVHGWRNWEVPSEGVQV